MNNLNVTRFVSPFPVKLPWGESVTVFDIKNPSPELVGCKMHILPQLGLLVIEKSPDFISIPLGLLIGIGTSSDIIHPRH